MKKHIFAIILSILLYSCESDLTGVIDYDKTMYEQTIVSSIKADSIYSLKVRNDSFYNVKISFNKLSTNVSKLQLQLINLNNNALVSKLEITKPKLNIDTFFVLRRSYYSGQYSIKLLGIDKNDNIITQQMPIAQIFFKFDNGRENKIPECKTVYMADTLTPPTNFVVRVKVDDQDGLEDIKKVYFVSYRPDGTSNNIQFELFDNGDPSKGDVVAKDGIYSLIVSLPFGTTAGKWKFYFYCVDYSNAVSNPLIKEFIIKY